MNRHNRSPISFKLLFVILFSLFILASCNKGNVEKPENVCTLTSEDIPEIRGFRLGISYDQIKNKFSTICKLNESASTLRLTPYNFNEEEKDKIGRCSERNPNDQSLNKLKFPEYEGIDLIVLKFDKEKLSEIYVSYETTKDKEFRTEFHKKITELLRLSEWTNWESKTDSFVQRGSSGDITGSKVIDTNKLICNQVIIETKISYNSQINNINNEPISYEPTLSVEKSQAIGLTKAQQQNINEQKQQQDRLIKEKIKAEENQKRETFKP